MKKVRLLVGLFGAITLMAGATSCEIMKPTTNPNGEPSFTTREKNNVAALTSIKMVESAFSMPSSKLAFKKTEAMPEASDEELQKILPTLDALLQNGLGIESTIEDVDTVIDEITYKTKETISFKDSLTGDNSYTLVYNKTLLHLEVENDDDHEDERQNAAATTETPAESTDKPTEPVEPQPEEKPAEPTEKPTDKPAENQETEESYKLEGWVILSEEQKFKFTSLSEVETKADEKEEERFFHIEIDANSYVRVEQEHETEAKETETEFSYKLVNNGITEVEYSISIENEKDKFTEIEYELNGVEYELSTVENNGQIIFKIEVEGRNDDETKVMYKKHVNEDGTITYERLGSK